MDGKLEKAVCEKYYRFIPKLFYRVAFTFSVEDGEVQ